MGQKVAWLDAVSGTKKTGDAIFNFPQNFDEFSKFFCLFREMYYLLLFRWKRFKTIAYFIKLPSVLGAGMITIVLKQYCHFQQEYNKSYMCVNVIYVNPHGLSLHNSILE